MSSTTCPSCASGINEQLYLAWLSLYCYLSPGWNGLPTNWNAALPGYETLEIGQQVGSSASSSVYYEADNPFTSQFITDTHMYVANHFPPSCTANCVWLNSRWNVSIVDGDVAEALGGSKLFPQNYTIGGAPQDGTLYLDLTLFCSGLMWGDLQGNCSGLCDTDLDNTGLLWWLNMTCGDVAGFPGLPANWRDSLFIINSTYPALSNFISWPSCLDVGNYPDCQLTSTESNCTSARCGSVDQNGDCSSVPALDLECFCSQVKYGSSCTANCGLSWQRAEYLNWLNDTCSPVASDTSLPGNWTSLLPVQRSEMLPWTWQLASDSFLSGTSQPHCPSASSKLLAFAAVNIAMFLLIPIIGRRTVIKKLSFGFFGRQESRRWYYTGPLAVGLHLASNAVNASIIKSTVGFEDTSIKDLTFFWCTRPRLAWLVVALLPYQAEKSMYFSATASILFGEVILQLFGAYYMGIGANYARRQKFFLRGHLVGTWYAKQAMIMYAGSMLWLTAVPFAIAACIWSILGVSDRIQRLGKYWTETRSVVTANCAVTSTQAGLLRTAKSKMKPPGQVLWQQQVESLQSRLSTAVNGVIEEWGQLTATWKNMPTELRKEENNRRNFMKRARRANDRLEGAREGTEKWQRRWQAAQSAEQDAMVVEQAWLTTPEMRQNEARAHQAEVEVRIADNQAQQAEVRRLVAACERRILPFEHRIAEAQARIAADDAIMDGIKLSQRRLTSENREQVLELRNQYESIVQQRKARLMDLKTAENNPQLSNERNQAADLQALFDVWEALFESTKKLRQNWEVNEEQWSLVAERRRVEQERKPKVGHFPVVVVVGMLLCWIAQWLWWAGYVEVAGDGYCPPKLPLLASIWTIFSGIGRSYCSHGGHLC